MNILFLTSQIPIPNSGSTIRPYHLMKIFSEKYNYTISLISFTECSYNCDIDEVKRYCQEVLILPIRHENNEKKIIVQTLKNILSPRNIVSKVVSKNGVFDPSYYSRENIQEKIDQFIECHSFDAIYSDAGMAGYVANSSIPKVIEPLDANSKNWLSYCIKENGFFVKVYWLICFLQTFYREIRIYNKFDYCVLVTEDDKKTLNKYLSNLVVIPNGVDIDYFKSQSIELDHPSLVFTGVMNGGKNIEAVLYFYSKIYPTIKAEYPNIKFYVVGKDPTPKIYGLSKEDSSIIITGFVKDVRPYVSKSSVFICPHISGSGIKNKVLEAMSLGKPVVTTPIGILGINAISGKEVVVAKNDEEFSLKIIEFLKDEKLRQKIGENARELIISQYSWENTTKKVSGLFENICNNVKY